MSLRVLLADESPSIKKAFELALKDYSVQIQTVHHGVDVKELCDSFQPDVCFLDILLPKRNGYDASLDIKKDNASAPPIVLMWSGFMEIDEDKFKWSHADDRLEKPFETKTLRSLVNTHVPKVKNNQISSFVEVDEVKDLQSDTTKDNASENQQAAPSHTDSQPEENEQEAASVPPLKETPQTEEASTNTKDSSAEEEEQALPEVPDIESILHLGEKEDSEDDEESIGPSSDLDEDLSLDSLDDTDESDEEEDDFSMGPAFDLDSDSGESGEDLPSLSDDSFETDDHLEGLDSDKENDDEDLDTFRMEPLESFSDEKLEEDNTPPPTFQTQENSETQAEENSEPESPSPSPEAFSHNASEKATAEVQTPPDFSTSDLSDDDDFYTEQTDPSIETLNENSEEDVPPPLSETDHDDFTSDDDEITPPPMPMPGKVEEESHVPEKQTSYEAPEEKASTDTPPPPPPASETAQFNLESQLSKEELKRLIMAQSKDIIESVVWDVVPELAKEMIKKEIERLTGEIKTAEDSGA